jgi:hypothetical protein
MNGLFDLASQGEWSAMLAFAWGVFYDWVRAGGVL